MSIMLNGIPCPGSGAGAVIGGRHQHDISRQCECKLTGRWTCCGPRRPCAGITPSLCHAEHIAQQLVHQQFERQKTI